MNTQEDIKLQILTEFKQVLKLAPTDYTENYTNVVMSIIDNLLNVKETETRIDTLKICLGHQETGTILNYEYFSYNINKLEQQLLKIKENK